MSYLMFFLKISPFRRDLLVQWIEDPFFPAITKSSKRNIVIGTTPMLSALFYLIDASKASSAAAYPYGVIRDAIDDSIKV
jgi:hypothetical protein